MFEEGLITFLLAQPGLALLIGTRIHDLELPQSPTLPAVVWQKVSAPRVYSHSGPSGLANPRIQFSCWATTTLGAKQVAQALNEALSGYSGAMGATETYGAFIQDESDRVDPETGLRRVIVDYRIWHKE